MKTFLLGWLFGAMASGAIFYEIGRERRVDFECADWGSISFERGLETGWQKCGCQLSDAGANP